MNFKKRLNELKACGEAVLWLKDRTPEQALAECERGDWLLWWFDKEKDTEGFPDNRKIILTKARCAKLVIHLMKDERSINAADVADDIDAAIDAADVADDVRIDTLKKCADICREIFFIPENYCKEE